MHTALRIGCLAMLMSMPSRAQSQDFALLPALPLAGTMVYDSTRGVVVILEQPRGTRLWEWDGTAFAQRMGPQHIFGGRPAFDPVRGEIHSMIPSAVATWNGVQWTTAAAPLFWDLGSTAFDPVRRRLVGLFATAGEVAEWDGVVWSRIAPANNPGSGGRLVFDPSRGTCVRAGGSPVRLHQWDGRDWTLIAGGGPPNALHSLEMTFDPLHARLVLMMQAPGPATWTFSPATGWQQIPTPAGFTSQEVGLAFDGRGILRLGASHWLTEGLWRLEGNVWRQLPTMHPSARDRPAYAGGPASVLMFGGQPLHWGAFLNDTWVWDGSWRQHSPATVPPARARSGMAWSPSASAFVLFGGIDAQNQPLNDTWEWHGTDWRLLAPTVTPPARRDHMVVQDPGGGVLVMGGTADSSTWFTDQWRLIGGDWTNLGNAPFLMRSWQQAMASYDPVRRRTVVLSQHTTWEWNGAAWTQMAGFPTGTWPPDSTGMGFDPVTQRTVVHQQAGSMLTAQWDGVRWHQTASGQSGDTTRVYLVSDVRNRQLLSLQHRHTGSSSWSGAVAAFTATPALAERFGYGCGLGGAPGLMTHGRPVTGNGDLALDLASLVPRTPCLLAFGFGGPPLHMGSGCVLWVGPPALTQMVVTDGAGHVRVPLGVPPSFALRGQSLSVQAAVLDRERSVYSGVTFSDGLRISIGN